MGSQGRVRNPVPSATTELISRYTGKTVISASLIEHVQGLEAGITILYYFCSHFQDDTSSMILKSFVLQLMNVNPDMAAVIHTNYVQTHREPSVKVLKLMLSGTADKPGLLSDVSPCRIIVDGVDECASQEQKPILQDLLQLVSTSAPSDNCKLLVSSRDLPEISRILKNKAKAGGTVPLSGEKDSIDQTIANLSRSRLSELASERETWHLTDEWVSELSALIVGKADGECWCLFALKQPSTDKASCRHDAVGEISPRHSIGARHLERIA